MLYHTYNAFESYIVWRTALSSFLYLTILLSWNVDQNLYKATLFITDFECKHFYTNVKILSNERGMLTCWPLSLTFIWFGRNWWKCMRCSNCPSLLIMLIGPANGKKIYLKQDVLERLLWWVLRLRSLSSECCYVLVLHWFLVIQPWNGTGYYRIDSITNRF